jgi:hypothetical protein
MIHTKIKTVRMNIVLPEWLKTAVRLRSEEKGIPMTQYVLDAVKDAVKRDEAGKNKL